MEYRRKSVSRTIKYFFAFYLKSMVSKIKYICASFAIAAIGILLRKLKPNNIYTLANMNESNELRLSSAEIGTARRVRMARASNFPRITVYRLSAS